MPSRDRTAMREEAKRRIDDKPDEPKVKDGAQLKELAMQFKLKEAGITMDKDELDPVEKIFDDIDDMKKFDVLYMDFKQSDAKCDVGIQLLARLIKGNGNEKGKMISMIAKANKLKYFCANLIKAVQTEPTHKVRYCLSELIEHVAHNRKDKWPELQTFVHNCASSSDRILHLNALSLMGNWLKPAVEWSSVSSLIVDSVLSSDSTLRMHAIKALHTFINRDSSEDNEMLLMLDRLMPIVLKHTAALNCLLKISLDTHRVVRHQVEEIFTICTKLILDAHDCKEGDNRHISIQMMTTLSDKFSPAVPVQLIPDIVTCGLLSIASGMDDYSKWLLHNPFVDDQRTLFDWAHTKANWYFARIATAIGKKRIGLHLMDVTLRFLKDGDWAKRAAALVGLTALGDNFRRSRVPSIVDAATTALDDTHPRVRYESAFLLGVIFILHKLNDHPNRVDKVFTALISLVSDSIPRVSSMGVGALTHVAKECPKDILAANYDVLLPLLIRIIGGCPWNGPKKLPSHCLELISYLAVAAGKERFMRHFTKLVSAIGPCLKSLVPSDSEYDDIVESAERIFKLLGPESSLPLLILLVDRIDKEKDGHRFLALLIKAVDGSKNIEDERRIAPFVKKLSKTAKCADQANLSEEERATLKRILASPDK